MAVGSQTIVLGGSSRLNRMRCGLWQLLLKSRLSHSINRSPKCGRSSGQ